MLERGATEGDIDGIVAGLGGENKFRFDRGTTTDGETHMIRATQGHSAESGVAEDASPVDEEVLYAAHDTSMEAARAIVVYGLNRFGRLHVHFHACDVAGRLLGATQMRRGTPAAIVVSSAHAREEGLVFYRSPSDVILSAGEHGIIPPLLIRRAVEYPRLQITRGTRTRKRQCGDASLTPPVANGPPFGQYDDGAEDEENRARSSGDPIPYGKARGAYPSDQPSIEKGVSRYAP